MSIESQSKEDKQSLSEWKETVETVAAFATSEGGVVRIGVDPAGKRIGVRIGKGTLEDLINKIKTNTDPPQYPSIAVDGPVDSAVIIVHVEESPVKPVWAFGRSIKRVGRTNQRLSREEAQRMMEMTTGRTWDALPCQGFGMDDIENEYVKDYLRRADLESAPVMTLLKNLGIMTNKDMPCNTAALLFARNPQRFFPEAQVKCARFAGTTSAKFIDEKTFDGNVLDQLMSALAFTTRNTREEIRITGKAERQTIPEYPDQAAREAIVNAICHRDYAAVGTVQVRIYNDRLEVWNPGTLPPDLPIETLYHEHASRPRNPRLAQAFYRARLIEHWGTGTLRMIGACEGHGINLEFSSEGGVFKVRFLKAAKPVQVIAERQLNPRQMKALEYVRIHGQITNREYQDLYGVHERQARHDLTALMNAGLVQRVGKGRSTRYLPSDAGLVPD